MALHKVDSPFAEAPVEEVPLTNTPLESVLFQVRFPGTVSRLQRALNSNELQDCLAEAYPYAEQQETFNLVIQPGHQAAPQPGPPVWTLQSSRRDWVCTLSADSVGLTTKSYESRSDFVQRARELLRIVDELANPPQMSRVGVRYLNRVPNPSRGDGDWIQTLAEGARGILVATSGNERRNVINSLSQVLYGWPDSEKKIQCRWGVLPSNAVLDAAMNPVPDESWVLDIDAFQESEVEFAAENAAATIEDLAHRAYRFFRWVVTPDSLERFGVRGDA